MLSSASMLIWAYLKVYFQKKLLCTTWWIFGVFFELNTQCTCHLHYNTVALETFLLGNLIWVLF